MTKPRRLARTKTKLHAEEVRNASLTKRQPTKDVPKILIPSGSTMINLACSDDPSGAYRPGTIINLIGDTSAGKSFLALTQLAEICYDKRFDKYDLYYDDAEQTNEFDMEFLFGKKFIRRLKLKNSIYAEEAGDEIHEVCEKAVSKGRPFIYVTDSWDVLKSKYEEEKERKNISKRKKGQKEEGSYGDRKAMMLHKFCRLNVGKIAATDSLWVIISQTKDNFGPDAMFNPKIVTGGNAIKFYPSHRVWLTIAKREYDKGRETAVISKVKIVKNKFSGKRRNILLPIYYGYGVDDIGSCIWFLNDKYSEEHWKTKTRKVKDKSVTAIDAKELGVFLKEKRLIRYIEENNLECQVKEVAGNVWKGIEESIMPDRKSKYNE